MTIDIEQLYERIAADMRTQHQAGVEVRDHRYGLVLWLDGSTRLAMRWSDDHKPTCCALMAVVATAIGPDMLLRHGPALEYANEQVHKGEVVDKVSVAARLLGVDDNLAREIMQGFDLMESPISDAYPTINTSTIGYGIGARLRMLVDSKEL